MKSSTGIQQEINEIDTLIQQGASDVQLNVWEMKKVDLKKELAAAQAAEASQAEREQAQTEKVDSIVLPLDFNELFDNTAANDMVIEVVKSFQNQAYADHNAEIAQINADWQEKIRAASERELQLQRQNEEMQKNLTQSNLDKQDAESKRDAAAKQLDEANAEIERLNGHVSDLQQQLANAPAPKVAIEIGSTERLTELAAKAKESTADSAARALARWNSTHEALAVPALDIPALPQVKDPTEVQTNTQDLPTTDSTATEGATGNAAVDEVVEQTEQPVTRAEHEDLKARVAALEGQNILQKDAA